MYEYLTHMRLVQNAQALMSLIVLYMVWTGWNDAPELHGDLARFASVVTRAGQAVERPDTLADLVPEAPDHKASLHRDLRAALGRVFIVDPHSLPIELLTSFPKESATVGVLWRELQNQRWRVPDRLTVPRDVLEDMGTWLDEWRRCYRALERHLNAMPRNRRNETQRYTTPTLRIAVFPERRSPNMVSVILQIAVYSPAVRRHYCRGDSKADFYERNHDLEVTREYKRWGPLHLRVQNTRVSLPASLFDRYPQLARDLGEIGDRTLEEARAWAVEQQWAGIRERDLRLVGARFTGEDLGVITPVALVILHVYMLIMLRSLNSQRGSPLEAPIPWLVAVPSAAAVVWSVATLWLLPAAATYVALWRLTTASAPCALAFALIPLGVAGWNHAEALQSSGNSLRHVRARTLARISRMVAFDIYRRTMGA